MPQSGNPVSDLFIDAMKRVVPSSGSRAQLEKKEKEMP